jgi:hypothetical protein
LSSIEPTTGRWGKMERVVSAVENNLNQAKSPQGQTPADLPFLSETAPQAARSLVLLPARVPVVAPVVALVPA